MPSTPQAPALDCTFSQASSSTSNLLTLSIRLNHLFPLTPVSRATSIFSLQTPRLALWRCHRSSPPCLEGEILDLTPGVRPEWRLLKTQCFPAEALTAPRRRHA